MTRLTLFGSIAGVPRHLGKVRTMPKHSLTVVTPELVEAAGTLGIHSWSGLAPRDASMRFVGDPLETAL
jgi:hypothetical protein